MKRTRRTCSVRRLMTASTPLLVSILAACSNGVTSMGEVGGPMPTKLGIISIKSTTGASETDSGSFTRIFGTFSQPSIETDRDYLVRVGQLVNVDRGIGCEYSFHIVEPYNREVETYVPAAYLNAGDAVVFSTPFGTWHDGARRHSDRHSSYELAVDGEALPADSKLDVLGDEFPAFADVVIPTVEVVEGFAVLDPTEESVDITRDSNMTDKHVVLWTPSEDPLSLVEVSAFEYDFNGAIIKCVTPDDGEFSFPADISRYEPGILSVAVTRARLATFEGLGATLYVQNTAIGNWSGK